MHRVNLNGLNIERIAFARELSIINADRDPNITINIEHVTDA